MQSLVSIPERELKGEERKLYSQVRQTLWDYEPLRASHALVVIGIQGRHVHLTGRTRTLSQKIMASVLVERMEGVSSLTNALMADVEVVRVVADALAADPRTAPYTVQVDVQHGMAILKGPVPDETTRAAVLDIASRLPQVAAVRDSLEIGGPSFAPGAVVRHDNPNARPALTGAVGSAPTID